MHVITCNHLGGINQQLILAMAMHLKRLCNHLLQTSDHFLRWNGGSYIEVPFL